MKQILLLLVVLLTSCSKDNEEVQSQATANLPTLTSKSTKDVLVDGAYAGGSVTNDGGAAVTARGMCWGTTNNPTVEANNTTIDGSGVGEFLSQLTNLEPGTKYYVRAYATNTAGTAYGNQSNFTTHIYTAPVTDSDGNVYQTIQIGTQLWIRENLKTTKFCNGDVIANITGNEWFGLTSAAWCYFQNDPANNAANGKLYNWYAVNDSRNICPCNWHVPTEEDWDILVNYLGGQQYAGEKMKATSGWLQNDVATNTSGFSGLPAGLRVYSDTVLSLGRDGVWWVNNTPSFNSSSGSGKQLYYSAQSVLNPVISKVEGLSVRCVQDE